MTTERGGGMALAVPGDISTLTGGYIYDRRLADALTGLGYCVRYLSFGDSFPHPSAADMTDALAQLAALPRDCPVLVDGLAFGALETKALANVRAPLVALVHHPLALEPGLSEGQARDMAARESANLALARHIVVTSPHIAGLLMAEYAVAPHRISVAQPGFDPPTAKTVIRETPPLILSVGLLARRKGHDILLHALARIADLDWQAKIVGRAHEPYTASALHDMCVDLGLEQRVQLVGEVSQPVLDALYRRASLFALATRYEGYGIVFAEAMGHGLPIVSTRAGAVPDTVAADAGLLVVPEDPIAFANALRRMLSDPEFQGGCSAGAQRAATGLPGWDDAARVAARALFATEPADET
ncbi:glycosyltransferase family 4 protein [uncultured Roseovarius sp.]|uniref:glycosyltransferase family 4 protein n=1 Tax=uncultured Roseovarius sp. TaxID=293344 RepID=UPI0026243FFE|nr:glycosyltransferase family 4 protein [uncultured Roseovarius sp.]